ncbi:MAG: hypothetical protein JWP81_1113 [Ferruginibacter sp.]|nr:hypothetical protein [Ferruginibacter sp.]
MEENKNAIKTLYNLLYHNSRMFMIAEILLKNHLPGWIDHASSSKLKSVLNKYLDLIQKHVEKMEDFFFEEEIASLSLTNRVLEAFIDDTNEKIAACSDAEIKDACLLASIQAINHYKISSYGTAASFANALGLEKQAGAFHEAEVNEKQIDDRLSHLAEHEINNRAKGDIAIL